MNNKGADQAQATQQGQSITIFTGCEVRIENSVTRITVRCDAEQLSRVTEFSVHTEQPLLILFLTYSSLDDCI